MTGPRIHILYEYGIDTRPHSSAYIRLLRPLQHPSLQGKLQVTAGPRLPAEAVDLVIVDRLWRPDITPELTRELIAGIQRLGARLIYAIDDNLLDLPLERSDWPQPHHLEALRLLLEAAARVWVTTPALADRLAEHNPHIDILPNQLDERLLSGYQRQTGRQPFNQRKQIGYMGTTTHSRELEMIRPALVEIWRRYPEQVTFQIVGGASKAHLQFPLGMPVRQMMPPETETEYPLFQFWFSHQVIWDIALCPLIETPFTRCKSDIKFLDYSAIGAAGIFSNVTPYQQTVRSGETGRFVGNTTAEWVAALETLVLNDDARQEIARQAAQYLYQGRILAQTTSLWMDAIETALN